MTISSRRFPLLALLVAVPALAWAQAKPAKPASPPPPRPVVARPVVTTPSPIQQWQRQVDRQQIENTQRQNAVREQMRQTNMNQQRTNATDPALRNQLDNADRSQQQLYRAQQDDATRRYQTQPRPAGTAVAPARASTAGR